MLERIVTLIDEKKAEDIVVLHIGKLSVIADYFVICTGRSVTQVKAISDHVTDMLKEKYGIEAKGIEGLQDSKWVLMDYGQVILHVFRQEEREFYNLERLWGDAEQLPLEQFIKE